MCSWAVSTTGQDSHSPVTKGGDEVQAAVHTVILDVLTVETTLVTEILLKLLVHVVSDGLPAVDREHLGPGCRGRPAPQQGRAGSGQARQANMSPQASHCYHSELLTASPNPGVSTMVSFSLTPFSSMSTVCFRISTVWLIRSVCCGGRAGRQSLEGPL